MRAEAEKRFTQHGLIMKYVIIFLNTVCVRVRSFFFHYRFSVRSVIVKYNEFVSNEAMTDIIRTLLGWNKKYLYRLKNKKQSIEKYKSI